MKSFNILFFILLLSTIAKADSLWLEADSTGEVGKSQIIKVIFGSYNKYHLQKIEGEFQEVKDFTCWLISPKGKHIPLTFLPKDTAYETSFIPEEEGVYVVLLENKQRKVEDWSKSSSKIGITKQHYYARTSIQVGNSKTIFPKAFTDLTLLKSLHDGRKLHIQVLFHGKPVPKATVTVRHPEMKEQKFETDNEGKIVFKAPKSGRYFALVVLRFETPGTYKGTPFDVFREKATLTMVVN